VAYLRYGEQFAWLSMMLVEPEARRSGIGTRLTEAALDALAGESCVMLDATALGEPLYRRFGFQGEYELVRGKIVATTGGLPGNSDRVQPMGADDLDEVFARDREVFGADRSGLLARFYRRAPDLAWVAHGEGGLAGYCFGRPGYRYRQIGPVVAEGDETARELVRRCLEGHAAEEMALDVPLSASEWLDWLGSVGFTAERPFLRMRQGTRAFPGQREKQFAIAGPEFG
jgi:predicted GNAT family N-acyltransferase